MPDCKRQKRQSTGYQHVLILVLIKFHVN